MTSSCTSSSSSRFQKCGEKPMFHLQSQWIPETHLLPVRSAWETSARNPSVSFVWWNAPRFWRDFGSALPFQTRLTQTKPVLPLSNEHGLQVKEKCQQQCCHNKHKKFPYRPTRDVSLLSGHASYKLKPPIELCGDGVPDLISTGQQSNLTFVARRILAIQLRPLRQAIPTWLWILVRLD